MTPTPSPALCLKTCLLGTLLILGSATGQAATAALTEARRSTPSAADDPGSLRDNALRRCQVFTTPEERERCTRMADGAGSSSGSVLGGGVIKELVTREPAPR